MRRLAEDDDIFVARPVLEHSERLVDPDLLNVARTKSQLHLLAISNRNRIAETITDVLVRRRDREVVRNVAGNLGACLSQTGFSTLVRKAERDGILAEKVGQRPDTPQPLFPSAIYPGDPSEGRYDVTIAALSATHASSRMIACAVGQPKPSAPLHVLKRHSTYPSGRSTLTR